MEFDNYDFQDVPYVPDTYDSYDFQNVPDYAPYNPAQDSQLAYDNGSAYSNVGDFITQPDYSNIGNYNAGTAYDPAVAFFNSGTNQLPDYSGGATAIPQAANLAGGAAANQAPGARAAAAAAQETPKEEGALSQIMKGLGLSGKLSDPKTLDAWMKLIMGGGGLLNSLMRQGKPQNQLTPEQLRATLPPQPANVFTPQQQGWANTYFNTPATPGAARARQYAHEMRSPIVPGVRAGGFAGGGDVPMMDPAMMGGEPSPGALSLVAGDGGGQGDMVQADLSPGEYVFDADTVASVGDGDNATGAAILDAWRENLRSYKRAAPPTEIPPPTGDPNQFMPEASGGGGSLGGGGPPAGALAQMMAQGGV